MTTSKLATIALSIALLAGCHKTVKAQVSVAPGFIPHIQFLDINGKPLGNGMVFTYSAGTTTLRNTYRDALGVSQNNDPIILDAGGFADIWLDNNSFKFVVQDQNGVQQWTEDNVTGYLGLLNLANTWTFPQIFTQPPTIQVSDNQLIFGQPGSITTFDVPPCCGSVLHFQTNGDDFVVNRNSIDILLNKTLNSPTLNTPTETNPTINTVTVFNGPATYFNLPNIGPTGTVQFTLTKLTGDPAFATQSVITDIRGIVGITISGAGTSGTATIQSSGPALCTFDSTVNVGDYVEVSGTVAGNCHSVGATYPTSGTNQVVGRALESSLVTGAIKKVNLWGTEAVPQVPNPPTLIVNSGSSIVNASIGTSTIATAGSGGSMYRLSVYINESAAGTGCSTNSTLTTQLTFTDNSAAGSTNVNLVNAVGGSSTVTIVNNGTANTPIAYMIPMTFWPKAATAINYSTTYTGGTCTTAPFYHVIYALEQLGF